jgi:DNA-binding transcriptional MocR family regulator
MGGAAELLASGPAAPHGYAPLCDLVRARLANMGIDAGSAHPVLTDGAANGMDLLIRCFLKAGDCVMVEDPGYTPLFASLRLHGVAAIPVRRLADGPDLDQFDTLARTHRPAMFFTQSVLHDPTGSSTSPANAHRLLKLAEQHGVRLVENDVYGDLVGPHYPRLATLDQLDRVFYIGSFAEALPSAVRVGFVVGPAAAMHALRRQKLAAGITGSQLDQRLMYLALSDGHYQRHMDHLRERLGAAMQYAGAMLAEQGVQVFCHAQGGKFLWVRAATVEDSADIARRAADENIFLVPGNVFRCQDKTTAWFRFNIAYGRDPRVVRFLSRLGRGR